MLHKTKLHPLCEAAEEPRAEQQLEAKVLRAAALLGCGNREAQAGMCPMGFVDLVLLHFFGFWKYFGPYFRAFGGLLHYFFLGFLSKSKFKRFKEFM